MSKNKKVIHLSLFENLFCEVCGVKTPPNQLHCEGCLDAWIEKGEKTLKKF